MHNQEAWLVTYAALNTSVLLYIMLTTLLHAWVGLRVHGLNKRGPARAQGEDCCRERRGIGYSASFLAETSFRSAENYLFSLSMKIFSGSKYPKKYLI